MVPVRRVAAAAVVLFFLLQTPAFAQVTTADIVGRVTDSRGAPLEGMVVHAYDRNLDPPAPKFLGNSATDAAG